MAPIPVKTESVRIMIKNPMLIFFFFSTFLGFHFFRGERLPLVFLPAEVPESALALGLALGAAWSNFVPLKIVLDVDCWLLSSNTSSTTLMPE